MVTADIKFEEACKILGLDIKHASVNHITKAYRSLAKKYHPDKNPGVDPGLFVRITDAKNTALKHVKNNMREPSPPAKPLKLEIVPGETEFKNVGRREVKSRDFIVYSVGGPFTRFVIDRKQLPKWIHISSVTRTTNEELPARVTVRVTGPELGDHHECHIPVKIENKNTGCSEETRVLIKLTMKEPKLHPGRKSFVFFADQHGRLNNYKESGCSDIPPKNGKARYSKAHTKINIAKPPGQPWQKRKTGDIVKIDPRKAILAITVAAVGLFLFSIVCIINTSPPSYPSIEQPGEFRDTDNVIPVPAVRTETSTLNAAQSDTTQPKANKLTDANVVPGQPEVNQYWSVSYANNDNITSNLTYPADPPVATSDNGTHQYNSSTLTSGKTAAKPVPVNHVKKKDGGIRHPFLYVDYQVPRNRFDNIINPRPPHPDREKDN